MPNLKDYDQEKALIVGVRRQYEEEKNIKENLDELELLLKTAGASVEKRVIQTIKNINSSTFIGKGKAKQIIEEAENLKINIIVFDDDLTPAQIKNYHQMSKIIKVMDRSGLILDIFQKHARTKEAKTQVDLAYLEYLLPRLTRQWTHLERQMGGIGTRAGMGETQIEIDRRLVRNKISKLKKELNRIEKERSVQGKDRKKEFRVALVGYTNAGKSTLFKALTGSDVFIEDQLFATLDTTIRKLKFDPVHVLLLSDTVGFIRKLPHGLIASFRSTLKEVQEADLIIKVFDISSNQIVEHMNTINDVLNELNTSSVESIIVLNKVDSIQDMSLINKRKRQFPDAILISAMQHLRISELKNRIISLMERNFKTIEIVLPYDKGRLINQAQVGVEVLNRIYDENGIKLVIRGSKSKIDKILMSNIMP
tara:strand:- start:766 stop:2037 length:1272 start_codon:yes stop_codon:yes gene_type:complete